MALENSVSKYFCHLRSLIVVTFLIDTYLVCTHTIQINRGSYMSALVLLNLLNELRKRDKMQGLPSIFSFIRNEFNIFSNTEAQMLYSILNY